MHQNSEELSKAAKAQYEGDYASAFTHLENAHVLGQESTYWHLKVHWLMLLWGINQKNLKEVFGQVVRIVGAALLIVLN